MRKLRRLTQHFTLILSALATLALCGCGGAPPRQPLPPTPTSLAGLQQAIQTILSRNGVPGAGIALVNKDKVIWAGGVGVARLAGGKPMTADTMFRVGPITQTFVSLALLQLQEQKKIDLNAKLAQLAPTLPFQNPWRATSPVTVAELLENTAGFNATPASEAFQLTGPEDMPSFDVATRFPQPLVSRWPPGTRMSISQPGYGVAGYLIWKASGLHFDQYINLNLLQPLGMNKSGFTLTDKIFAQLAQGYHGDPPRPVRYLNIYLRPAGDLKSSPAELAKLVQMFLNGGKAGKQQIVTPASITRMEYPQTTLAARTGLRDGYGLANESILNGPVVQHGIVEGPAKDADGYLSSFGYMPDQGVGYVALINNDSGERALRSIDQLLARYLLAGQTVPQPPSVAPATVAPPQLGPLTGYYEKENPRNRTTAFLDRLLGGAHVSLSGGRLYLKEGWFGPQHALIPAGNNQFRLKDQAAASVIFFRGPSGNKILATSGPENFFGRRRGAFWPLVRLILVLLALLAILSSFGFALWWIPRKLLKKMKKTENLALRVMPLLAGLSLLGAVLLPGAVPIWVLGSYNIASVGLSLLTWLFATFSVLGFILAWPAYGKPGSRAVFWHSLVVSAACFGLTIYMAYWHILGIHLWRP